MSAVLRLVNSARTLKRSGPLLTTREALITASAAAATQTRPLQRVQRQAPLVKKRQPARQLLQCNIDVSAYGFAAGAYHTHVNNHSRDRLLLHNDAHFGKHVRK